MIDYSNLDDRVYYAPLFTSRDSAIALLEKAKKQENQYEHEYVRVDAHTVLMKRIRRVK